MHKRIYFPLGLAADKAFCNRTLETKLLLDNIANHRHTLLMAPRRYGKSSLAGHVLNKSQLAFVDIDFYMASNEQIVENYIINAVIELIGKAIGSVDKLVATLKKYLKHLQPKLAFGGEHVNLELTRLPNSDPATNVKDALMLLEKLLADKQKHAVMLFDEFQNVGVIAKGFGVEAAIRHVAQKTKHLTLIFSGSNRKLLATMFEDDTRPLYKLCWKLCLERIQETHYQKHITKIAHIVWRKALAPDALQIMMELTERHPYYVNKLGDKMLAFCEQPPSKIKIEQLWQTIIEEEKSDAVKEISQLSPGQKQVLREIATAENHELLSHTSITKLGLSGSSITTALKALMDKDIIEKIHTGYQIINPIVRYFAAK